jgi:hypothetical protein
MSSVMSLNVTTIAGSASDLAGPATELPTGPVSGAATTRPTRAPSVHRSRRRRAAARWRRWRCAQRAEELAAPVLVDHLEPAVPGRGWWLPVMSVHPG